MLLLALDKENKLETRVSTFANGFTSTWIHPQYARILFLTSKHITF